MRTMIVKSKATKGLEFRKYRANSLVVTKRLGNGSRATRKLRYPQSCDKFLAVFVLGLLALSAFAVLPEKTIASEWRSNAATAGLRGTPHAPIYINGNSEFTPANGVVGGSGTETDPYIIEGWEIDGNGGYCICIQNTTAHFVVRNCKVFNSTQPYPGIGIVLSNATNGTLENNLCTNSIFGISLFGSSSIRTINNTVMENDYGIYLSRSINNIITNNNASSNSFHGIFLYRSTCNNIAHNTASNNSYYGIWLDYADNNILIKNTVMGNGNGTYLWVANNNTIEETIASSNSYHGIFLYSSTNNSIINNTVSGNPKGIRLLSSSDYNNITNNDILRNGVGISLDSSSNNSITYNWICNNTGYGIHIVWSSTSNKIYRNKFIANNGATRGVSGNCQAYDSVGGNYWYDNALQEGNYWSNWDGQGWGTPNAYPIDGGKASDWYPLGNPVSEFSHGFAFVHLLSMCIMLWFVRKKRK